MNVTVCIILTILFTPFTKGRCHGTTYLQAISFVRYVESDNYPRPYLPYTSCAWSISSSYGSYMVLKPIHVDLECGYDSLKIYDGQSSSAHRVAFICDESSNPQILSSGKHLHVTFTTDRDNYRHTYSGFKLAYQSVTPELAYASTVNHFITSDGYPVGTYQSSYIHMWKIIGYETVFIEIMDTNIEDSSGCLYDALILFDGPSKSSRKLDVVCGEISSKQYKSSERHVLIQFKTDDSAEYKGFKLRYISPNSGLSLYAWSTAQQLLSPGYGYNYFNNMHVNWSISASQGQRIKIQVTFFDLESCCDNLKIYDGISSSGTLLHTVAGVLDSSITSSSNYLYVKLDSDGSVVGDGFILLYSQLQDSRIHATSTTLFRMNNSSTEYPYYDQSGTTSGVTFPIFVAIVAGSTALLALIISVPCCVAYRRRKSRSRQDQSSNTTGNVDQTTSTVFALASSTHVNPVFEDEPPPRYTVVMREINRFTIPQEFRDNPGHQRY